MNLPDIPISLNTSSNNINEEFYLPCLKWAHQYDRGVGYFTSGWIKHNALGMASFASRGGKARWITSPILDEKDYEAINSAETAGLASILFNTALANDIDALSSEIENDALNALAWMIYDQILEFRFAVPKRKLAEGDFHDKFGVFYDEKGKRVSFVGSINDSAKGFANYESITVFKSWDGLDIYIDTHEQRFEKLWTNDDFNVQIFHLDDANREKIFRLRTKPRPYKIPKPSETACDLWSHQSEAVEAFMKSKHGILEMATGTGKTRTAFKIMNHLLNTDAIDNIIITTYGNDLLDQWEKEILTHLEKIRLFKFYGSTHDMPHFLLYRGKKLLLVSLDASRLFNCLYKFETRTQNPLTRTILIFDEVHRLGSASFLPSLSGRISPYQYRLGLSATPERKYDGTGNEFILQEIGAVIYEFPLEKAIEKGILCEFDYYPLSYELTQEEKQKKRDIIAVFNAKKKNKEPVSEDELYQNLARVNKLAINKTSAFENFIRAHTDMLERCIIFVETKEYSIAVQDILLSIVPEYHTYYSEDDNSKLKEFATGGLKCLITCKKISEGVDIKSVKNIVLFSSDRSKLVTVQRIGRSLRINPEDPDKRANIIDFICDVQDVKSDNPDPTADHMRMEWLRELSKTRRMKDGTILRDE